MNPLLLLGGAQKLWGTIFGSKEKRDKYNADVNTSIHTQFGNEFGNSRNLFDSFMDGLNRLPRPLFAFHILAFFDAAVLAPEAFAEAVVNINMIPMEMWGVLSIVITFYFGDRVIKGWGKNKIKHQIAKTHKGPSAAPQTPLKGHAVAQKKSDADHQEGITWEEKVQARYSYND